MHANRHATVIIGTMLGLFMLMAASCAVPAAAPTQNEPELVETLAIPVTDDATYVIAVIAPDLLQGAVPILMPLADVGDTSMAEAPDTELALVDALTWSVYRPIVSNPAMPDREIPGLDVTTIGNKMHVSLPPSLDSQEVAANIERYLAIRQRAATQAGNPSPGPTPCPGPTPTSNNAIDFEPVPGESAYTLPLVLDTSQIGVLMNQPVLSDTENLLALAGPYVVTKVTPSEIVMERNPFFGEDDVAPSQIVFVTGDQASVEELVQHADLIYDPAVALTQTVRESLTAPLVESQEDFLNVYATICPECIIPEPVPASPCWIISD